MLLFFLFWGLSWLVTSSLLFQLPLIMFSICAVVGTWFHPGVIREDAAKCKFSLERKDGEPTVIALHAGSLEHPENTLAAIESTIPSCRMVHLDCALTKDYKVVCIRNDKFEDLTGVSGKTAADYDYADLPPLLSTLKVMLPEGKERILSTSRATRSYKKRRGCRIPLLTDALKAKPVREGNNHNYAWLETHEDSRELAQCLSEVIESTESSDRVIWSSSNAKGQEQLDALGKDVGFVYSSWEVLKLYGLYYTGFLAYYRPTPGGFLHLNLDVENGFQRWLLWNSSLWAHMKARGYETILTTAPNAEAWKSVFNTEAFGLTTRMPSRVRKAFIQM